MANNKVAQQKGLTDKLKSEVADTEVVLADGVKLYRRKCTTEVYLIRNDEARCIDNLSLEDLDFLYVKEFFTSVNNEDKLAELIESMGVLGEVLSIAQGDNIDRIGVYSAFEDLVGLSKVAILNKTDILNMGVCTNCPIKKKKNGYISKSQYCTFVCNVGRELQLLGAIYNLNSRIRQSRGRRDNIVTGDDSISRRTRAKKQETVLTEDIYNRTLEELQYRLFKQVTAMYSRLTGLSNLKNSSASKSLNVDDLDEEDSSLDMDI